MKKEEKHQDIAARREKLFVRIFLLLFIVGILHWLIFSNIEFITLDDSHGRVAELPQWLKEMSPLARGIFINIAAPQITYWLITLGLIILLFNSRLRWKWNQDRFLSVLGFILIVDALFVIIKSGFLTGFRNGWYDTMFYGLGFGIFFLLQLDLRSFALKLILWTRLIDVFGPGIGYIIIPAVLGRYTGGAYGHFGYGLRGIITSLPFWTDIIVSWVSVVGVMYLLKKAGYKWFWIISFAIGAIIVGLSLTYILPVMF